ncbi:MAG: F0F1 ATP synthase subunit epsilon [Bacilli bacterium]
MSAYSLTILSPQGLAFEGEVLEAYFPSLQGPLGILPGHTPYIAALAENGVIRLKESNGNERYFAIHHGALEVRSDKTIALVEECQSAANYAAASVLLQAASQPKVDSSKDVARAEAALTSQYKSSAAKR